MSHITLTSEQRARLAPVKLLAMDVDGVLTDGGVYYDDAGNETKRFHIHDGLGIVLAGFVGLRIVWITGRASSVVERRARELNVFRLVQSSRDKAGDLARTAVQAGVAPHEVAYIGDDLNDIPALRWAAAPLAPANAVPEVLDLAIYVTRRPGGAGAIRDAVEAVLRARGDYEVAVHAYLLSLDVPAKTPVQ